MLACPLDGCSVGRSRDPLTLDRLLTTIFSECFGIFRNFLEFLTFGTVLVRVRSHHHTPPTHLPQTEANGSMGEAIRAALSGFERNIPSSGYIRGGDRPSIADLAVFDLYSNPSPGLLASGVDLTPYPKVRLTSRNHCMHAAHEHCFRV